MAYAWGIVVGILLLAVSVYTLRRPGYLLGVGSSRIDVSDNPEVVADNRRKAYIGIVLGAVLVVASLFLS